MAESASVWRCGRGGGRAQGHERGGVVKQWIARVIGHVAARGAISGRREAGGRGAQLSRHHHVFTCLFQFDFPRIKALLSTELYADNDFHAWPRLNLANSSTTRLVLTRTFATDSLGSRR